MELCYCHVMNCPAKCFVSYSNSQYLPYHRWGSKPQHNRIEPKTSLLKLTLKQSIKHGMKVCKTTVPFSDFVNNLLQDLCIWHYCLFDNMWYNQAIWVRIRKYWFGDRAKQRNKCFCFHLFWQPFNQVITLEWHVLF